jgi:hypothetical protein
VLTDWGVFCDKYTIVEHIMIKEILTVLCTLLFSAMGYSSLPMGRYDDLKQVEQILSGKVTLFDIIEDRLGGYYALKAINSANAQRRESIVQVSERRVMMNIELMSKRILSWGLEFERKESTGNRMDSAVAALGKAAFEEGRYEKYGKYVDASNGSFDWVQFYGDRRRGKLDWMI